MTSGLIDMSAAKLKPIVKVTYGLAELKEVQAVYKETIVEAADMRFVLMQKMGEALSSRVQPLPGTPHPGEEIQQRLQFIDRSITRLRDLIGASTVIIDHLEGRNHLDKFPGMMARLQDGINAIVDNRDKTLAQTTPQEGLLVAGFRDYATVHPMIG
jgi:hypothetical protein